MERLFPGPELQGLRTALMMVAPAEGMPALGVMVFLAFALRGDAHRPVGGTQKVGGRLGTSGGGQWREDRIWSYGGWDLTERARTTGVRLSDGSTVKSDYVVSAVDAHQMYDRMLDQTLIPQKFRTKLDGFPISQSYFIISLVTDLDPFRSGLEEADYFVPPRKGTAAVSLQNDPENGFFHIGFPHYRTEKANGDIRHPNTVPGIVSNHNSTWATGARS